MSEPQKEGPGADWWPGFFDDLFADLVLEQVEEGTRRRTAAFLAEKLALAPGATVFEQCCGVGTWGLELARQGFRVVGVDLQESYIRRARTAAEREGLPCTFLVGDAFTFVPAVPCDGAFNWFTSFGYTDDDARNRLMFLRAFEALRPGGRFALDTANLPGVFRDFQKGIVQRCQTPGGEYLILRDTVPDLARGLFVQRWTYLAPDGSRYSKEGATRMYLPHNLGDLLRGCGFAEVEFFGSIAGEPLTLDSPRCICVARKPEGT